MYYALIIHLNYYRDKHILKHYLISSRMNRFYWEHLIQHHSFNKYLNKVTLYVVNNAYIHIVDRIVGNIHWKIKSHIKKYCISQYSHLKRYSFNCRQRQLSIYTYIQWISCLLSGVIYFHYISDDQFMVNTQHKQYYVVFLSTVRIPFVRRIMPTITPIRYIFLHEFCSLFRTKCVYINTIRVLLGS